MGSEREALPGHETLRNGFLSKKVLLMALPACCRDSHQPLTWDMIVRELVSRSGITRWFLISETLFHNALTSRGLQRVVL
jgi:hypothetical protein